MLVFLNIVIFLSPVATTPVSTGSSHEREDGVVNQNN